MLELEKRDILCRDGLCLGDGLRQQGFFLFF